MSASRSPISKPAILVAGLAMIVLVPGLAGSVAASDGPSDEAALQATRTTASRQIEGRVNDLLGRMTVQEKLEQLQLLSDGQVTPADAKAGVGGVFSLT